MSESSAKTIVRDQTVASLRNLCNSQGTEGSIHQFRFQARLQNCEKGTIGFVMSVYLPAWNTSVPTGRLTRNLKSEDYFFIENLSRKFKFHYNLTNIAGTSHEDVRTFTTIPQSFPLTMRYVSDKNCIEQESTNFIFKNLLPKIVPFLRQRGKTW
jgi:hypothetical protein